MEEKISNCCISHRLDEWKDQIEKYTPASCKNCENVGNCENCEHYQEQQEMNNQYDIDMDKKLFENTIYADMEFTRILNWDDIESYCKFSSSPLFVFENGDIVFYDKYGTMVIKK